MPLYQNNFLSFSWLQFMRNQKRNSSTIERKEAVESKKGDLVNLCCELDSDSENQFMLKLPLLCLLVLLMNSIVSINGLGQSTNLTQDNPAEVAKIIETDLLKSFKRLYYREPTTVSVQIETNATESPQSQAQTTQLLVTRMGKLEYAEEDYEEGESSGEKANEEEMVKVKFGEPCSDPKECENYPAVQCVTPKTLAGLHSSVCGCDILHTQFNGSCVINVFAACSDATKKSPVPCGAHMDCIDDPLDLMKNKFCFCKTGYIPLENEDGIMAICVQDHNPQIVKHKDYRSGAEKFNLQLLFYFKVLLPCFTLLLLPTYMI